MRFLRRHRWPLVIPLYEVRECPDCHALVQGDRGQSFHEDWHNDLDNGLYGPEMAKDPGGYVIGAGPLPASVRGGEDE